jgi:hypothetical protein
MDIKTTQKGFLKEEEVKEIIKEYLKSKGYDASIISFDIRNETEEDDTFAQYPSVLVFKGVYFETK